MGFKNLLDAVCAKTLQNQLNEINPKVSPVTKGRTKRQREIYLMWHFLATFKNSELFEYPLTVHHSDKPDFVLTDAKKKIGIECVEAVPSGWYAVQAYREHKGISIPMPTPHFNLEKDKLTKSDVEKLATGQVPTLPWMGNKPEKHWAKLIANSFEDKVKKLRQGNYQDKEGSFDETWLLIQEEARVPVHSKEDLELALKYLKPKLEHLYKERCFDKIFIHSCGYFVEIEKARYALYKTNK